MKKSLKNFWIALIVMSLSITLTLALLEGLVGLKDMFCALMIVAVIAALLVFVRNTRQEYHHYKRVKAKNRG